MDLRIVKTRKSIRSAFLELRKTNAVDEIRVNRLCEMAMINKTTFYKHYQDIYALAEEVEEETVLLIMNSFQNINDLYADPEKFMTGLYATFVPHKAEINTLFSGRMNVLLDIVERHLVVHYPAIGMTPQKAILLTFLITGASHVLMEAKYEETIMLNTLTGIARQIIQTMQESA